MKTRLFIFLCCLLYNVAGASKLCASDEVSGDEIYLASQQKLEEGLSCSALSSYEKNLAFKNSLEASASPSPPSQRCSWNPFRWASHLLARSLGKPDVVLESDPGWLYWAKRSLITKVIALFFKRFTLLKPYQQYPMGECPKDVVCWDTLGVPLKKSCTLKNTPPLEEELRKSATKIPLFYAMRGGLIYFLEKIPCLKAHHFPQILEDPEALMTLGYPSKWRELFPVPQCPSQITDNLDDLVGGLALAGPFGSYIQKDPDSEANRYQIDLESYQKHPVKDGFYALGGKALLKYDESLGRMKTESIFILNNCGVQEEIAPENPQWKMAQKIMLATLQTDLTLIRHLFRVHFTIAGTFCTVNNTTLPPDHALRRLMYRHEFMTLSTNDAARSFFTDASSFARAAYSYSIETLQNIFLEAESTYRLQENDVRESLSAREMNETAYPYPDRENTSAFWKIIAAYVENYVECSYPNEASIQADAPLKKWYQALEQAMPNGFTGYVPASTEGVTKEALQKLITLFIYTVSVEHEKTGNITFNYLVWAQYLPLCVKKDGTRLTIDSYQTSMDMIFLTNRPSARLMDDCSSLALDEKGKGCMKQFNEHLLEYQKELEIQGIQPYTLCPNKLEAAVSS